MWLEGDELVYLLETHHQGIEPKECSNIEKHWPCQLLLGNCFWREGFEAAFLPHVFRPNSFFTDFPPFKTTHASDGVTSDTNRLQDFGASSDILFPIVVKQQQPLS